MQVSSDCDSAVGYVHMHTDIHTHVCTYSHTHIYIDIPTYIDPYNSYIPSVVWPSAVDGLSLRIKLLFVSVSGRSNVDVSYVQHTTGPWRYQYIYVPLLLLFVML